MSTHIPQQRAHDIQRAASDVFEGFACKPWALQQPFRRQLQQCGVLGRGQQNMRTKLGGLRNVHGAGWGVSLLRSSCATPLRCGNSSSAAVGSAE